MKKKQMKSRWKLHWKLKVGSRPRRAPGRSLRRWHAARPPRRSRIKLKISRRERSLKRRFSFTTLKTLEWTLKLNSIWRHFKECLKVLWPLWFKMCLRCFHFVRACGTRASTEAWAEAVWSRTTSSTSPQRISTFWISTSHRPCPLCFKDEANKT